MAYLDHAATTPVLPAVLTRMSAVAADPHLGNPSSLHAAGRAARRVVEEAREQIAAAVGAHPSEVLFTSGGTESDNLAVAGLHRARRAADPTRRRILLPPTEHHAVLEIAQALADSEGAELEFLAVDPHARVTPDALRTALAGRSDDVTLVTVMTANNELGSVSPIRELAAIAAGAGVPLHSDAAQAAPCLPVDFAADGATAVSIAGHKLGGPGGTGILLLRRDAPMTPWLHGGGHERGLRSGTLSTAAIAGLAVAVQDAVEHGQRRTRELSALRERLVTGIRREVPDAIRTVPATVPQLPGIAHLRFPGAEAETLLMVLDRAGILCSAGAACTAGVTRASHVLLAVGLDEVQARSGLRFSLGHTTSRQDVDDVIAVIAAAVSMARAAARPGLAVTG